MYRLYLLLASVLLCLPGLSQAKAIDDYRIERGVHRPGSDYDRFPSKNANHCAKQCSKSRRCRAFDYNTRNRTCWLKDRVPSSRRAEDVVSGVKRGSGGGSGGGGGATNNFRIERGVHRPGSDYDHFPSKNVNHCARQCDKSRRCRAFDYNTRNRTCWLKDQVPSTRRDNDVVSGVKRGGGGNWNGGGGGNPAGIKMLHETQLNGNDYTNFSASNPKQCARRCAGEDRCRAFDFNRKSRKCYLKDRVPSSRYNRDHVSGVKRRPGGGHGYHGGNGGSGNWSFNSGGGAGSDVDVFGNPN